MANAWILKPLGISAASASSTSLGAPLYVGNDYMGVVWQAAAGASAWLVLDLGADVPVDSLMMFGLRGADPAATLQVDLASAAQGSGFGAGAAWFGTPAALFAGTNMLVSGDGVALWTAPAGAPATARYVRLSFAALGAGGQIRVSRVALGKRTTLERNYSFGAAFGVRDFGTFDFSARAVLLRRRSKKLRTIGITFSSAYRDEVEASIAPLLEEVGNTDCIALVTDPDPDPMRQRRCYFGPLVGDLGTIQRNAVAYEWRANLVSLA